MVWFIKLLIYNEIIVIDKNKIVKFMIVRRIVSGLFIIC